MPWLKLLHISAVIVWCGALLYLPAAISAAGGSQPAAVFESGRRVLRSLFTLVATPAALVAIGSGTAIFVLSGPLAVWLLAKLATVSLLVLAHALCGWAILRVNRTAQGGVRALCWGIAGVTLGCLAAIAWLVLRKPF